MNAHTTRAGLLALLVLATTAFAAIPPAGASTSTTTIAMPGPGHSASWAATITNPSADRADVLLTVASVDDPVRFRDLLVVSVLDGGRKTVIPSTPLARLLTLSPLNLGPARAGATISLGGTVTLSRDAGNDLQGRSASIVFRLSTLEQSQPGRPLGSLADTGSTIAIAAIALGAGLVVVGGGVLAARRLTRRRRR